MKALHNLKNNNPRAYAAFLSLLIALILLVGWWQVGLAYEDHLITREKETVTSDLALYANNFVNALNNRIALIQGLYYYVSIDPNPERLEDRFDLFASALYESAQGIRNLAVAPGGVQTYVYPYLTNEAARGHNLLNDTDPSVVEQNQQLLSGKELVIRGPTDLRQGGQGLIITRGIFVNGTWETGTLWGLTSIAIDMPPIYNETGLSDPDLPYEIAMRNDDFGVFYGDPEEFSETNVKINMTVGDETWQIAGCPVGGWESLIADELFVFQLLTFLLVVLATVLCYLILISRLALGRMVEEKTHGLIESEERFRIFFSKNPNPCYMIAEDGTILNINATALQLLGYTPKELIGKPMKGIYAPESQDEAGRIFDRWKEDGSVHNQELTILSKDGTRRQVLLNLETVTDSEGRILHSLSVQTDITALHDAECQIYESENRFRTLFDTAKDAIYLWEMGTDGSGRILLANQGASEMLGYTNEEFMERTMADLRAPQFELSLSSLKDLKKERALTVEWMHLTKDGRSLPVEISLTQFESAGKTLAVSIVRDISDRKKAEKEKDRALTERGVLLAEIHHRVNNNLQILLSMLTLEEISYQDELASNPLAENLLSGMENRIRAIALVHENLYLSGKLTGIRLHDHIVILAREILNSEIGRVYITYTVEGGEDIIVPTDRAVLLSLVLSEILTNVLKYAFSDKEQGTVTILISQESEQLCLDISDDGVGMPADMDLSTTESVGLSMIYKVVTVQLKGTIELLDGTGTIYQICIPGTFGSEQNPSDTTDKTE